MNKITVSAPGKLMLLGEYAVLYNRPCLVTAVDRRFYATVEKIDKPEFQLEAVGIGLVKYKKPISKLGQGDIPKGAKFVEVAVANVLCHPELARPERGRRVSGSRFRNKFGMTKEMGIRVTTKSEFSSKLGFGSSSAVTVCTVKAISELFNLQLSNKEIFDLSYKTVLDIQGRGSGFDIVASLHGGTIYFMTGGKAIKSLDIKSLPLIVGYSGVKADTTRLINKVKKDFSGRKNRLEKIFDNIEALVYQGKEALIKTDWKKLGVLMNQNQDYLRELGVSTHKLDKMINASTEAGAYGAKLSGAGGGDCMIALVNKKKKQKIIEAIRNVGGEAIDIKTGAEGIRIE